MKSEIKEKVETAQSGMTTNEAKYKKAYHHLLEYWDSLPDEAKHEINKDLNEIFGEDHEEYVQ